MDKPGPTVFHQLMPTPVKQHRTASLPASAGRHGRAPVAALRATVVAATLLAAAGLLALSATDALRDGADVGSGVRAAVTAVGALVALRAAVWSLVAAVVCLADGTSRAARRAEDALRTRAPLLARRLLVGAAGASLVLAPLPATAATLSPGAAAAAPSAVAGTGAAGTGAGTSTGTGAAADTGSGPRTVGADVLAWPVLAADEPAAAEPPAAEPPGPSHDADATAAPRPTTLDEVVVRPGDTLWGLAAAALPAASDADLVAAWPVLHRLNRAAVGRDPDLLLPGTVLQLPAAAPGGRAFLPTDHDLPEPR